MTPRPRSQTIEKRSVFIAVPQKVLKNLVFSLLFGIAAAVDEELSEPGEPGEPSRGHQKVRKTT